MSEQSYHSERELLVAIYDLYGLALAYSPVDDGHWGEWAAYANEPESFPDVLVQTLTALDGRVASLMRELRLIAPGGWGDGFGYTGLRIGDVKLSNGSVVHSVLMADSNWYLATKSLVACVCRSIGESNPWESNDEEEGSQIGSADLRIQGMQAHYGGQDVDLQPLHARVLTRLRNRVPESVAKSELLRLWDGGSVGAERSLNTTLSSLRRRLETLVERPGIGTRLIRTDGQGPNATYTLDLSVLTAVDSDLTEG